MGLSTPQRSGLHPALAPDLRFRDPGPQRRGGRARRPASSLNVTPQRDTIPGRRFGGLDLPMRLPLTPYGRRETVLYGGLSLGLIVLISAAAFVLDEPALDALAVLPAALLVFTIQFFRDPERTPPAGS